MVGVLEKMFTVLPVKGGFQQCVDRESFSFLYNSFPFGAARGNANFPTNVSVSALPYMVKDTGRDGNFG